MTSLEHVSTKANSFRVSNSPVAKGCGRIGSGVKPALKHFLAAVLSAAMLLGFSSCKPQQPPLPPEKQRLLVFGAVLAEKNGMGFEQVFNKSASFKDNCKDILASAWEITDSDSAKLVLDWLFADGIRAYSYEYFNADEILEIASSPPEEADEESVKLLKDRLESYNACVSTLKNDYGYTDEQLENVTTAAAFDYDRLITLARWCCALEYLTEDELWDYAQAVSGAAAESYASWDEYFAGVEFGRAVTIGGGLSDTDIADKLLKSEDSPYAKYSFIE